MDDYLSNSVKQFEYYKSLGERTFIQLTDEDLFWQSNEASNSIAIIVKHLSGNMLSRWTDFRVSDGEKEWRNRDDEFESTDSTKEQVMKRWDIGWACLFEALNSLDPKDLSEIVYIRNMGTTIMGAINRQLCHYSYHIGQIVIIGKILASENFKSLSIPKGESINYNKEKFSKDKRIEHFTDDL